MCDGSVAVALLDGSTNQIFQLENREKFMLS